MGKCISMHLHLASCGDPDSLPDIRSPLRTGPDALPSVFPSPLPSVFLPQGAHHPWPLRAPCYHCLTSWLFLFPERRRDLRL